MLVIPRILLRKGRCVTLSRGRIDEPTIWHVDPVEQASRFVAEGASWIHVTDLDAVRRDGSNAEIVSEIIRRSGACVQVAGGMNSAAAIEHWIDQGAARVVIGTSAVRDPELPRAAAKLHPDQVAVSVDVWQGRITIHGWSEATAYTPEAFVETFDKVPLAAFILNDIDQEVDVALSSVALVSRIASQTATPVIAGGMVRNLDDISTLKYVYNVAGALVGEPLFAKSLELSEAVAIAQPGPEPIPAFQ